MIIRCLKKEKCLIYHLVVDSPKRKMPERMASFLMHVLAVPTDFEGFDPLLIVL